MFELQRTLQASPTKGKDSPNRFPTAINQTEARVVISFSDTTWQSSLCAVSVPAFTSRSENIADSDTYQAKDLKQS